MKVVWLEDEEELLEEGIRFLQNEGCEVYGTKSAEEAPAAIERTKPDLLLVDWTLAGRETGLDLCRLNDRQWQLPLLMVTARADEFDRILALELGADDFIQKPFSLRELHARMKAVMRRNGRQQNKLEEMESRKAESDEELRRGSLLIKPSEHIAFLDGGQLDLTRTEFALLVKLASRPGRVFTRGHLLEETLGDAFVGFERTIDSHIRNLRRKIESDSASPAYILTVYGVGYKFNPELGAVE